MVIPHRYSANETQQIDLPADNSMLSILNKLIAHLVEQSQDSVIVHRSDAIHHALRLMADNLESISTEMWGVIHRRYLEYRQDMGRLTFVLRGGDFAALDNIRLHIESDPELWERMRSRRRGNLGKRTLVIFAIIYAGIQIETNKKGSQSS